MERFRHVAATLTISIAVVGAHLIGASASRADAPARFFGVVPQALPTESDLLRMQGVVGTLRLPVYWYQCEPAPGDYDFAVLDAEIAAAADRGIRVQPFVYGTPSWLAPDPARPPLEPRARAAWARFLRVLVRRYGHGGELWQGRPRPQPIRLWQIWNEPNFVVFWHPKPKPAEYAQLLDTSARAVRGADRRARIVLAGVAPVSAGIKTWLFLRELFRYRGVRRDFDLAALHPYSTNLPELNYQVRKVRRAMATAGVGHRALLVTELGVASWGTYPSAFVEGPDGQARFLRGAYGRLLQMRGRWHIAGVDWFTWRDQRRLDATCSFCQGAGLFDLDGKPKPAWWAYRQAVKGAGVR